MWALLPQTTSSLTLLSVGQAAPRDPRCVTSLCGAGQATQLLPVYAGWVLGGMLAAHHTPCGLPPSLRGSEERTRPFRSLPGCQEGTRGVGAQPVTGLLVYLKRPAHLNHGPVHLQGKAGTGNGPEVPAPEAVRCIPTFYQHLPSLESPLHPLFHKGLSRWPPPTHAFGSLPGPGLGPRPQSPEWCLCFL